MRPIVCQWHRDWIPQFESRGFDARETSQRANGKCYSDPITDARENPIIDAREKSFFGFQEQFGFEDGGTGRHDSVSRLKPRRDFDPRVDADSRFYIARVVF